jgi:hypothetical protein
MTGSRSFSVSLLLLLVSAALARAAAGQDGGFQTEVGAAYTYDGGTSDRPLVVTGGVPSTIFFYHGDSTAYTLDLSVARYLCPVPDDGATPYALLAYVARDSSLAARFALTAASRDSMGAVQGVDQRITSALSGDRSSRTFGLDAEWFFLRTTALRGGVDVYSFRGTDAATTLEAPSGRGDLSSYRSRTSRTTVSLGLAQRFGGDHEIAVEGFWAWTDTTRTDNTVFTGEVVPLIQDFGLTGTTSGVTPSLRLLFLARTLQVDVAGTYSVNRSDSEVVTPYPRPFDSSRTINRQIGGAVTWYPLRSLGLTGGITYANGETVSGQTSWRLSSSTKTVALSAAVRWWASSCVAGSVTYTQTNADTLSPPDSDTYQQLKDTNNRVVLAGTLRF